MSNKHKPKKNSADFKTAEHYYFEIETMPRTKNLLREELLTSFLQRASDLSSSGLQIDSEGYLYSSGEMIAAWRELEQGWILFIDCGSDKLSVRNQVHALQTLAEEKNQAYIGYNEYCIPISPEFQFVEKMVSYPIWTTPKIVNPKNISKQLQKVLDKSIEKNISLAGLELIHSRLTRLNSLFGFELVALDEYKKNLQSFAEAKREIIVSQIEHHRKEIARLKALL